MRVLDRVCAGQKVSAGTSSTLKARKAGLEVDGVLVDSAWFTQPAPKSLRDFGGIDLSMGSVL